MLYDYLEFLDFRDIRYRFIGMVFWKIYFVYGKFLFRGFILVNVKD